MNHTSNSFDDDFEFDLSHIEDDFKEIYTFETKKAETKDIGTSTDEDDDLDYPWDQEDADDWEINRMIMHNKWKKRDHKERKHREERKYKHDKKERKFHKDG